MTVNMIVGLNLYCPTTNDSRLVLVVVGVGDLGKPRVYPTIRPTSLGKTKSMRRRHSSCGTKENFSSISVNTTIASERTCGRGSVNRFTKWETMRSAMIASVHRAERRWRRLIAS